MAELLMTIDEVAHLWGTTSDMILRLINSHHLPSHYIGSATRFKRNEIEQWLCENPNVMMSAPAWHKKLGPQVRALDSAFFFPAIEPPEHPHWLQDVLRGDFLKIPDTLDWESAQELALVIDGYALAPLLGLGECGEFANDRAEEAKSTGRWAGTAIELWLCLFFEQRRWRQFDCDPEGEDKAQLNSLCIDLRNALISEDKPID